MKKPFRDTEAWKWIRTLLEIAALVGVLFALSWVISGFSMTEAHADEPIYEVWVMCRPDSEVYIRSKPRKDAPIAGSAVCGDYFRTDWRERNGFVHVTDVPNESGEGWISKRYIVCMEPMFVAYTMTVHSRGRVAVRNYPQGKRTRWVANGTELRVYCVADGWAVTELGYIMTQYLEAD